MTRGQGGFTLIEVLVASSLLILTIGAVVTIGRGAIQAQDVAMERTQAYELVQEGLEIVRQIRDTAFAQEQSIGEAAPVWDRSLAPVGEPVSPLWDETSQAWRLVRDHAASPAIAAGTEELILGDAASTIHFFRTIRFEPPPDLPLVGSPANQLSAAAVQANARRVVVTVRWQSLGEDREVSATTLLTNWKVRG